MIESFRRRDDPRGFEWKESGVEVVTPTRTGFGSRLIRNMVAPYFDGVAHLDFEPDGVKFRLQGKL